MYRTSQQGKIGKVGEKHTTTCKVSYLWKFLQHMTNAFKLCLRLRDKLLVHQQFLN